MTQMSGNAPLVEVKAQPNVYTLLLLVAIVALVVTMGIVLNNLVSAPSDVGGGYGLDIGSIFKGGAFPR